MTDDLGRSFTGTGMGDRVTTLEVELVNLGRRFERHVDSSDRLLEKLDARMDRNDIVVARLLAGISILVFLGQVFAPVVRRALGLPA